MCGARSKDVTNWVWDVMTELFLKLPSKSCILKGVLTFPLANRKETDT